MMDTFPLQLIGPGEMFGVFEALDTLYGDPDTPGSYSVSSGSVSIRIVGTRLKDKNLPKKVGAVLGNSNVSWKHASEPACHFVRRVTEDAEPWHCEVLIIPSELVARAVERSRVFEKLLYRLGWEQSSHARKQIIAYSVKKHLQKNGAFGPLVQYLQSVCLGQLPAFRLSHRVQGSSGPFLTFQKALYTALHQQAAKKGQQPHYPFVVQPAQLKPGETGFYSFNYPLPYLTVKDNKGNDRTGVAHCQKALDIVRDHYKGIGLTNNRTAYQKHFRFFCNGTDGKPYPPGKNPVQADHYTLKLEDFLLKAELESLNGNGLSKVTKDHMCLTDDFFTTGVMLSR